MVRFEPGVPRKFLSGHLLWALLWLGVTITAVCLHPSADGHGTHRQLGLPPCLSVIAFHRLCPGCGLTTSFTALVHGEFATAWNANPFGVLGYLGFTVSALACAYGFATERRMNTESKAFQWTIGIFIATYLVFGVWRFITQPVTDGGIAPIKLFSD